jgi:hypothetical protein
LLDASLFHSYLFRRLLFLAGPVVAHCGTAVAFAMSHSTRPSEGESAGSFLSRLFNSLGCQFCYHVTGRLSLAVLCNSFSAIHDFGTALEYCFVESSSWWRQFIIYWVNWKYTIGSTRLPNQHSILCFNKLDTTLPSLSPEELQIAQDFINRYIHYYTTQINNQHTPSENQSLNWEDITDIIYNLRSILSLILFRYRESNPEPSTKSTDLKQFIKIRFMNFRPNINSIPLISTDAIGSWAYATYHNETISPEVLRGLLLDELKRVRITSEQLKSFEESFCEINSLLDLQYSRKKEEIILEMIDSYYKSVIDSVLKTSLGISSTERIVSLPLFPDAIMEGLSRTPPPPSTIRSGSPSRRNYEDLCFASRRGAMLALNQHGLTIRKWNQLLDYYSVKYPKVDERREKWIQYLNSQNFEQLVMTDQRSRSMDDLFGQDSM